MIKVNKLPVTMDSDSLGHKLICDQIDGYITSIDLVYNNKVVNFLEVIQKNAITLPVNSPDRFLSFDLRVLPLKEQ